MSLGARLLRGLLLAAIFAALGWIASKLTVGMLLSRHFNSAQKTVIEQVLPWIYLSAGFAAGVAYDPLWLNRQTVRPICWGAVGGLTLVMLCVRVPIWLAPELDVRTMIVFGTATRLGLAELGLLSAPGALIAGGFLGWFCHRTVAHRSDERILDDPPSSG